MMHYTDLLTDIDSETHIELSLKCNVVLRICFIFSVHLLTTTNNTNNSESDMNMKSYCCFLCNMTLTF